MVSVEYYEGKGAPIYHDHVLYEKWFGESCLKQQFSQNMILVIKLFFGFLV